MRAPAALFTTCLLGGCALVAGLGDYADEASSLGTGGPGTGGSGAAGGGGMGGGGPGAGGTSGTGGAGGGPTLSEPVGRWLTVIAGDGPDYLGGLAISATGRPHLCGHFMGELTEGALATSAGSFDLIVAQLKSESGIVEWAHTYGDDNAQICGDLAVDGSGDVVFTASAAGSFMVGPVLLDGSGRRPMLARLASGGDVQGATEANGTGTFAYPNAVDATSSGIWYGGFAKENTLTLGTSMVNAGTAPEGFLGHNTNSVNTLQALDDNVEGDTDDQEILSVDNVPGGGALVAGYSHGLLGFGSFTHENRNPNGSSVFVGEVDINGNPTRLAGWRSIGSVARATAVQRSSATGDIYVAGFFTDTLELLEVPFPDSSKDGFVARLDGDLNVVHAIVLGGAGDQEVLDLALDDHDNIYLVGTNSGFISLPGVSHQATGTAFDGFILALSPNLQAQWLVPFESSDSARPYRVATDPSAERVAVGGAFKGVLTLPPELGGSATSAMGSDDIFVALFDTGVATQ